MVIGGLEQDQAKSDMMVMRGSCFLVAIENKIN